MSLIKTNNPDFWRDESSNALINTNVNAYKLYKQQRQNASKNVELDRLKDEVAELKLLVKKLLEEKNV